MPCEPFRTRTSRNGRETILERGFMCSRGGRTPKCSACKKNPSTKQCDWPIGKNGKTCSKHLCDACAVKQADTTRIDGIEIYGTHVRHVEDDTIDFCPHHVETP